MSDSPGDTSASNHPHTSADEGQDAGRIEVLRRKELVDRINYVNFLGQGLAAIFRHTTHESELALPVVPLPCAGDTLDCTWQEEGSAPGGAFTLQRLEIQERDGTVHIVPEESRIGDNGISISLPEVSSIVVPAASVRYEAREVDAYLLQNGIRLGFDLVDYSVEDFRLRARDTDAFGYDLLNVDDEVTLVIESDGRTVYSSRCVLATAPGPVGGRFTTLIPCESDTSRFPPLEYRSGRRAIENAPVVYLRNPLSRIEMSYVVSEISGTGFAVEETERDSRLIPGLILFDAKMIFPDRKAITLTIQVVYRQPSATPFYDRCGIAILDISAEDHLSIMSLLQQNDGNDTFLSAMLNLDDLWRFFFESGFIYPEKYGYVSEIKDALRDTYQKLYCRPNDVARHFVVQRDHRILGHLSMVRFYEKAWLIQHHASVAKEGRAAGLRVLNQVGRYASEAHRFRSMNLRFLMAYYRPENRFPARVFGGLVPFVDDPQECSVDSFALTHIETAPRGDTVLPGLYSIDGMTENDFRFLDFFYSRSSGGMLLEAMHIPPYAAASDSESEIEAAFRGIGLERSRRVLALRKNDELVAAMVINRSDVGINLSELTNSITFLVIDQAALPRSVFDIVCREVARTHSTSSVPVLVYPQEAAEALGIAVDRVYNQWIMRTTIGDKYFKHLNGFMRHVES
jgi:hypothetical protein